MIIMIMIISPMQTRPPHRARSSASPQRAEGPFEVAEKGKHRALAHALRPIDARGSFACLRLHCLLPIRALAFPMTCSPTIIGTTIPNVGHTKGICPPCSSPRITCIHGLLRRR